MSVVKLIYLVLVAIFYFCHGTAMAGSVEGPYIVWVNLSEADHQVVDREIREYLTSKDGVCWNDGALLYMTKRPLSITASLVRSALIDRNKKSIAELLKILHHEFDIVPEFDGLVAYSDSGDRKLISISANGKIKVEPTVNLEGQQAIGPSFCIVLPPISHKP